MLAVLTKLVHICLKNVLKKNFYNSYTFQCICLKNQRKHTFLFFKTYRTYLYEISVYNYKTSKLNLRWMNFKIVINTLIELFLDNQTDDYEF